MPRSQPRSLAEMLAAQAWPHKSRIGEFETGLGELSAFLHDSKQKTWVFSTAEYRQTEGCIAKLAKLAKTG